MSLDDDFERRLENWARWTCADNAPSRRVSSLYRLASSGRRDGEAPMPIINGEAMETQAAFLRLSDEHQAALLARYQRKVKVWKGSGFYEIASFSEIQVAAALLISYDTYLRRVKAAKVVLKQQLRAARVAAKIQA